MERKREIHFVHNKNRDRLLVLEPHVHQRPHGTARIIKELCRAQSMATKTKNLFQLGRQSAAVDQCRLVTFINHHHNHEGSQKILAEDRECPMSKQPAEACGDEFVILASARCNQAQHEATLAEHLQPSKDWLILQSRNIPNTSRSCRKRSTREILRPQSRQRPSDRLSLLSTQGLCQNGQNDSTSR